MSDTKTNTGKSSGFFDKIKMNFQKDFFKFALFSIWIVSIVFLFIINLIVIMNGENHYTQVSSEFQAYDITKLYLELILSIFMIASSILIFFKRTLSEKIGIITSSIAIFQTVFIFVFFNVYSSISGKVAEPSAGWNFFRHGLIGILHIAAIIMMLIDMRKTKKATQKPKENIKEEETNKKSSKENKNNDNTETKENTNDTDDNIDEKEKLEKLREQARKQLEEQKDTKTKENNDNKNNNSDKDDDEKSSLSEEDLEALDQLSNMDVVDSDKEKEEAELKNLADKKEGAEKDSDENNK